jgi:hypothetical protein
MRVPSANRKVQMSDPLIMPPMVGAGSNEASVPTNGGNVKVEVGVTGSGLGSTAPPPGVALRYRRGVKNTATVILHRTFR